MANVSNKSFFPSKSLAPKNDSTTEFSKRLCFVFMVDKDMLVVYDTIKQAFHVFEQKQSVNRVKMYEKVKKNDKKTTIPAVKMDPPKV